MSFLILSPAYNLDFTACKLKVLCNHTFVNLWNLKGRSRHFLALELEPCFSCVDWKSKAFGHARGHAAVGEGRHESDRGVQERRGRC